MRYATAEFEGVPTVVAVDADGTLRPVTQGRGATLSDLLALAPDARERALTPAPESPSLPAGAPLLAPLRPASIVCIGLNYLDHVRESGQPAPKSPLVFTKLRTTVIGPDEAIRIDRRVTEQVDWEV